MENIQYFGIDPEDPLFRNINKDDYERYFQGVFHSMIQNYQAEKIYDIQSQLKIFSRNKDGNKDALKIIFNDETVIQTDILQSIEIHLHREKVRPTAYAIKIDDLKHQNINSFVIKGLDSSGNWILLDEVRYANYISCGKSTKGFYFATINTENYFSAIQIRQTDADYFDTPTYSINQIELHGFIAPMI